MARKTQQTHQPFEGRNPNGQFVKITLDMMDSKAWQGLTGRQRDLYIELKKKYRQQKHNGVIVESNKDNISMPESEWRELYGNYNTFRNDMEALLSHGFIHLVNTGKTSRTPNIYGFSAEWQKWTPTTPIDTSEWLNWRKERKKRRKPISPPPPNNQEH